MPRFLFEGLKQRHQMKQIRNHLSDSLNPIKEGFEIKNY